MTVCSVLLKNGGTLPEGYTLLDADGQPPKVFAQPGTEYFVTRVVAPVVRVVKTVAAIVVRTVRRALAQRSRRRPARHVRRTPRGSPARPRRPELTDRVAP